MHSHLDAPESWSFPVGLTAALLLVAILYLRGWLAHRRSSSKPIPGWQAMAFLSGLAGVWLAVGSPLGVLDHRMLTAHMVQHLMLMALAAPLMLLGAPVAALARALPDPLRSRLASPLPGNARVKRLGRVLSHPVFCWLAPSMTLIAWHLPGLFAFGMRSQGWHEFEQGT